MYYTLTAIAFAVSAPQPAIPVVYDLDEKTCNELVVSPELEALVKGALGDKPFWWECVAQ